MGSGADVLAPRGGALPAFDLELQVLVESLRLVRRSRSSVTCHPFPAGELSLPPHIPCRPGGPSCRVSGPPSGLGVGLSPRPDPSQWHGMCTLGPILITINERLAPTLHPSLYSYDFAVSFIPLIFWIWPRVSVCLGCYNRCTTD